MGDLFLDGQRREPVCEPHDGCVLERKFARCHGGPVGKYHELVLL